MKNLLITILILFCSINLMSQDIDTIDVGDIAYDFTGISEKGNEIKISDFKGKYILLNFTHTFCTPCWDTYGLMNEVQKKYLDELIIISFHVDNEKEKWQMMAKNKGINFECISIWKANEKPKIDKIYKVTGFPQFFLIDKNGIIIEKWFGNFEDKFKSNLEKHIE